MATAAQMQANRRNAQKSTGPRTPEGKAVVAQNAVKHGLTGQEVVIQGEDPGEFEFYRERMLAELDPLGEVEADLADRIVDLSWRLKRAAKLHAVAFDSLYARQKHSMCEQFDRKQDADGDSVLGRALVRDFGGGRVLDRLLMYERRIEHSLYRSMAELKRHRILSEVGPGKMWELRRALASDDGEEKEHRGRDARATKAGGTAEGVPSLKLEAGVDGAALSSLDTSHLKLDTSKPTPDGVTTNEDERTPAGGFVGTAERDSGDGDAGMEDHGWDARATRALHESSCKAKPILPAAEGGQVPRMKALTADSPCDESDETKPISGDGPSRRGAVAAGVCAADGGPVREGLSVSPAGRR